MLRGGVNPLIANVLVDNGAGTDRVRARPRSTSRTSSGWQPRPGSWCAGGPNTGQGPYDTMSQIISQHPAGGHDLMGRVRAARGVRPGVGREHPVPAGGGGGDDDRLGVGRLRVGGLLPGPAPLQVDDPASQPYVTGVGGTSLGANARPANGRRKGVERRNDVGASGGGVSASGRCPAIRRGAVVPTRDQRPLLGGTAPRRRAIAERCPTCPRTATRPPAT